MLAKYKVAFIIAGCLAIMSLVFLIFYYQTIFKTYSIPTSSNEPTIPTYSMVIMSSIPKIKKNDFIVFERYDSVYLQAEAHFIYRLVASEGDTIEIKKGVAFVNGENVDALYNLKHLHKIHFDDYDTIEAELSRFDFQYPSEYPSDTLKVFLNDEIANKYGYKRWTSAPTAHNESIEQVYNEFWNKDKFGPLIIPENKLFVLGDNRDNAMDSRYIGLIDESQVVGVIISR